MAFVNYHDQRVKKLIHHYYGDKMQLECNTDGSKSIMMIIMILYKLFQLKYLKFPQVKIERILIESQYWKDINIRRSSSWRWYNVLFLIPTIELILILLLSFSTGTHILQCSPHWMFLY